MPDLYTDLPFIPRNEYERLIDPRTCPDYEDEWEYIDDIDLFNAINNHLREIDGCVLNAEYGTPDVMRRILKGDAVILMGEYIICDWEDCECRDRRCYTNVAHHYIADPERFYVMIGYTMSGNEQTSGEYIDPGLWIQHAWLWDKWNGHIFETTTGRDIYYGIILQGEELQDFLDQFVF